MGRHPSDREAARSQRHEPGMETLMIKRPRRFTRMLTGVLALALVGGTAVLGGLGWLAWQYLAASKAPAPADKPVLPARPAGDPVELAGAEKSANDALNASLPADFVNLGPNRVDPRLADGAPEPAAPVVSITLPGRNRQGQQQELRVRQPSATALLRVAADVERELGLTLRFGTAWTTHAARQALQDAAPELSCSAAHLVDAVDLDVEDTDGKQPLTLGADGKPILLKDLETPAGKRRFLDVVRPLAGTEASPATPEILEDWAATAADDLRHGVWGMQDVTMEIWRRHGWSVGHCGVLPARPWHAQPGAVEGCQRGSADYQQRLRAARFRAAPGPEYLRRGEELLRSGGPWLPAGLTLEALDANGKANAARPVGSPWVSFNRVDAARARGVEDASAPLVTFRGNSSHALLRLPTAAAVGVIADAIRTAMGLEVQVVRGWLSNAAMAGAGEETGRSSHAVDAVDLGRADASGRKVLTRDLQGKPIVLEDLDAPGGAERFTAVVRRVLAKELKKVPPKKQAKLVDGWVKSAARDFQSGVWGVQDATMELWLQHGWAVGHCGERPAEPTHAEPATTMASCARFDDTYNRRLQDFRKRAPAAPDAEDKARKGGKRKGKR